MDVIRELRIASGLTQQDFSDILGFSQQAVSKWENNTAEPDISTLIKIAQYFEVSVDELLGLDSPRRKIQPTQGVVIPTVKFDTDWIRKHISDTAAQFHEYREELRRCEKQAEQLKAYINQLKKLMNITKTSVYKMEAIINEEQS